MDIGLKSAAILCFVVYLISSVNSLPSKQQLNDEENYLESKNLQENFKQLVYLSLQELASEGLVDSKVVNSEVAEVKRGRHQGFCFKKTKTGRFLPYICWKGEGEDDK